MAPWGDVGQLHKARLVYGPDAEKHMKLETTDCAPVGVQQSAWSHNGSAIQAVHRLEYEKIMAKPNWEEELRNYEQKVGTLVVWPKWIHQYLHVRKEIKNYSIFITTRPHPIPREHNVGIFDWTSDVKSP